MKCELPVNEQLKPSCSASVEVGNDEIEEWHELNCVKHNFFRSLLLLQQLA